MMGSIAIDRSRPFDAENFIGKGWCTTQEQPHALALTRLDLDALRFEHGLQPGEEHISGEEKLLRFAEKPESGLDVKIGQALYEQEEQTALNLIAEYHDISFLELTGTALVAPDGDRCLVYLARRGLGSEWRWGCLPTNAKRDSRVVSPMVPSGT